MSDIEETGRHVTDDGRVVYHWPPEGKYAVLWDRIKLAFPDDEDKALVANLLDKWRDETSSLVAYEEDGIWYNVEPNWNEPKRWLKQ